MNAVSLLDELREMTVVVADTGDIEAIERYRPRDATTNPSLIYKAAQMAQYHGLIRDALEAARQVDLDSAGQVDLCLDMLAVNFGRAILDIVPGRVSTEVDVRLSFDTEATMAKARSLIGLYQEAGVDRERVLIKIAATWEGIRAAEQLEREGIHCNLTLLFGFPQAVACAEAGVTLISPFVGRIFDWYKKDRGVDTIPATEDPGVASVTRIYNYFKRHGFATEVMGASFRNAGEIIELAGCDLLTISPQLLAELDDMPPGLKPRLDSTAARDLDIPRLDIDEKTFRWMMNEDAMATEKLAEGIRNFTADLKKLIVYLGGFLSDDPEAKSFLQALATG